VTDGEVFRSRNSSENKPEARDGYSVRRAKIFDLTSFGDTRGNLTVGQFPTSLPFQVKRFFFISHVPPGSVRGKHAHFKCEQFLVAIRGSVKVVLGASGQREEYTLDSSRIGLLIPPMTWGEQSDYSEDCVLLVLASHEFEEEDYITDYHHYVSLQTFL
jgi:dTDP-4-dehydrorhamnose 3,5-epimerase-like enzyme